MTILGKIDCTKIDKARLFAGNNGAKYLDIVILVRDEKDQYGNRGMICQSVSKEEREQGVRGPILGNIKINDAHRPQPASRVVEDDAPSSVPKDDDSNVPF